MKSMQTRGSGKAPFVLGPLSFKNKNAAKAWVSGVLAKASPTFKEPVFLTGEELEAFLSMFKLHPGFVRKFPGGTEAVESVCICLNRLDGGRSKRIVYRLRDGTEDDVSYKKCFAGVCKDAVIRDVFYRRMCVIEALRNAVKPFCREFRQKVLGRSATGVCALTGLDFPADELAVDHAEPFILLVEAWREQEGLPPLEDIPVVHLALGQGANMALADPATEESFRRMHAQRARLQLISSSLNSALSAKDKNSPEAQEIIRQFKSVVLEQRRNAACADAPATVHAPIPAVASVTKPATIPAVKQTKSVKSRGHCTGSLLSLLDEANTSDGTRRTA